MHPLSNSTLFRCSPRRVPGAAFAAPGSFSLWRRKGHRPAARHERSGRLWRYAAAVTALILTIGQTSALAHDMWIEPTTFAPAAGKVVGVRLRVGQDLLGDPVPRDPALIDQFVAVDAAARKPIVGQDGADPAGLLRAESAGLIVLGYRSRPVPITLAAAKFNQYLEEEGLETIAATRAARRQTESPAREIFVRCAKSLVWNGLTSQPQGDRTLGFTLELVAEKNPYAMSPGQEIPFRLTYEGRPIANVLVVAINRRNPSEKLKARSDADGRVRFRLTNDGMWLIKAVHMVEAPAGSNAEWASFWASLTFELKPAALSASR